MKTIAEFTLLTLLVLTLSSATFLASAAIMTSRELESQTLCSKKLCLDHNYGQSFREQCALYMATLSETFIEVIINYQNRCVCPCTLDYVSSRDQ